MAYHVNHIPVASQHRFAWSFRSIRWGQILKYQHWGGVFLFIPAVVVTGISHWRFQDWPVVRQALLYDATISYAHHDHDTIPNYLATLLNWICLVIAVLVVELIIFRRQHSLTVAICGVIHHIWCCLVSFIIVVAITEITKPFSGRLRPDFLARCQPSSLIDPSSNFQSVLSAHASALGRLHLGQIAGDCTGDPEAVSDGRLSFPSGHASNSMSVAWYTSLYLMWSLYLRVDNPYPKKLYVATTILGRLGQEVAYAFAYAFILVTLCLSWFIGMTRFWDNVHNISDVIGGFLLAIIFSTPYVVKAIGLHIAFRNQIDTGEEAAKAVRSQTSIMAASPAGPAAALVPYAAAYSDTEPGPGPGLMEDSVLTGSGVAGPPGPGGVGYPGVSSERHPQLPGRAGATDGGGDVVLQMSDRARK
jgi:membrane-associated phospholipid phosphatase